jgi:alpha,alpha-trehalase
MAVRNPSVVQAHNPMGTSRQPLEDGEVSRCNRLGTRKVNPIPSKASSDGWASAPADPRRCPRLVLLIRAAVLVLVLLIRATAMAPTAGGDEGASGKLLGLLQRVQSEALRVLGANDFDPKLYVDLPLAADESAAAVALPPRPSRAEFEAYLARYFGAVGSDLVAADPPDFDPEPRGFLPRVESLQARAWALQVHALWKELARRVAPAVAARPERHTLLPLPGRVVVPGSRFREVYYWDTYWVVRSAPIATPRFHLF